MSRNLEIDFLDEDPTDELPVLSEDALLEYSLAAPEIAPPRDLAASDPTAAPTDTRPGTQTPPPGPSQPAISVSRELQADLVRLFERIGEIEVLLAERDEELALQRAELAQQRVATEHWQREAIRFETRCIELEAAGPPAAPPFHDAAEDMRAAAASDPFTTELQRHREELEALRHYIDARNERIRALELELTARETRIAELTAEIGQRIEREREAMAQALASVTRADSVARRLTQTLAQLAERESQLREARLGSGAPDASSETAAAVAQEETLRARAQPEPPESKRDSKLFMAWPPAPGHASLVCMTSDAPTTYALEPSTAITIGRGEHCEVQVATHYVSREHARLVVDQNNVTVEDLSSRNGVFVNDVRVQTQQLKHGDLLTIGETQFRFVAGNPE